MDVDKGGVGQLSIALRHIWRPKDIYVILTAYLDESGTHDSDFSLVAGHVADARQWREYEKQTERLFKKYGVEEFHAIDVRRGRGSFKGWSVDRKVEFLDDFQDLINKTLEIALFSKISDSDYLWYRALDRPDPKSSIE